MAINTQSQYAPEPFTRPALSRVEPASRWQVSLGMGQLIVLWSTIAGVMVAVFVFGVYSGREQGFKQALEDHNQLAVRLPVDRGAVVPTVTDAISMNTAPQVSSDVATAPIAAAVATTDARDANTPDLAIIDSQIDKANEMVARLKQEQTIRDSAATESAGVGFKGMAAAAAPTVGEPPAKPGINRITHSPTLASLDSTIAAKDKGSRENGARETGGKEKSGLARLAEQSELSEPAPKAEVKTSIAAVAPVATKAKAAPVPNEIAPTPTGGSGWLIQVAAEKSRGSAQKIVNKLKARGFSAQIEQAVVKKTNYFRVLVGAFPTKAAAEQAQRKLVSAKLTHGASFIRKAG